MGLNVNVTLKDNQLLALLSLNKAVKESLDEIGQLVAESANSNAPVGASGALSSSYDYNAEEKSVTIGSPVTFFASRSSFSPSARRPWKE